MPELRIYKPKSLNEYVKIVRNAQDAAKSELWFRGCGKASFKLLPSLYRHPKAKKTDEFADLERSLVTRFKQRSIPFHGRTLGDGWDALFFMQHYGVPTRLLDWSENPFIAFFFAVMSASRRKGAYTADATVWLLDPIKWNRHALKGQSFKGGVLSSDDTNLAAYRTLSDHGGMPNVPLAIFGAHNSQRIVAQRGVFTVFGKAAMPMESTYSAEKFPAASLSKIVFLKSRIAAFREQILGNGITESVVMPDLDGLAREIRRQFGYET